MKKSLERFYPLIIFLLACLLYANTIPNDYNLDDELVTVGHRTTSKGFSGISEILSTYYYEDDMGYKYGFRPVTHISFAIEHQFFGDNPHVSHTINVLLYALLCMLIYYLTMKLAPDKGPLLALLVALVFVVHPLHTEVVASIKNRDEILSLLFGVLSFITALHAKSKRSWKAETIFWSIALLCFSLGLFAKQSIVFLVLLIPIASMWFGNRDRVVLPILFFVSSASVFMLMNDLNWLFSLLTILCTIGVLLMINAISNLNVFDIYKRVKSSETFQKQINLALTFGVFIVLGLANYLQEVWLHIASVLFAFLILFVVKNAKDTLRVSLLVFFYFAILGFKVHDEQLILLGFFTLVFLNEKLLSKQKFLFVAAAVLSIMATVVQSDLTIKYDVFVLVYAIALFAHLFYKPFWFALPFVLFYAEDTLYGIFYSLLIFFTFSPIYVLYLKENRILGFFRKYTVVWLSIFVVIQVYQLSSIVDNEATWLEEEMVQKGQVETEEIELVDLDRPILYVENPIVENWNLKSRITLGVNTTSFYLKKMLVPFPLTFYYGYGGFQMRPLNSWQTVLSFILIFGLICLTMFFLWKGYYYLSFSLLFLGLNLAPYSNLLIPISGVVGERLAFTSSLGFSLLLGILFWKKAFQEKHKLLIGLFVIIVLLASFQVTLRNFIWENKITLYQHDVENQTNSAQANALLADAYMIKASNGKSQEETLKYVDLGEKHFIQANEIYPKFLNWWIDLARVQRIKGDLSGADASLQKAREIEPNHTPIYDELLEISLIQNDTNAIIEYLNILLFYEPKNVTILFDLSYWTYLSENYYEVILLNDRIMEIDNSIPEVYLNKAYAFVKMNNFEEAKMQIEYARLLSPNHQDLLYVERLIEAEAASK